MVQQDVYLFAGTVAENIRYGKLEATDEEIIEAARKANAHDFIMALPNGYDPELFCPHQGDRRQAFGFDPDTPVILYGGRFTAVNVSFMDLLAAAYGSGVPFPRAGILNAPAS